MLRPIACLLPVLVALLLSGCKGDPKTPEYWENALKKAGRAQDRVRLLDELRDSGYLEASFLPMLHGQLASEKKADVKVALAQLLGRQKDRSSVQPLVDAVDWGAGDSSGHKANRKIAEALGEIGDPAATPTLLRLLKVRDGYVQVEAIGALATLRAKEAVEPLIAMAGDDTGEPLIVRKAIEALGTIADPRAIPVLVKLMFKQHERGQQFYAESSFALFQIGPPSAEALLPVLAGEDKALLSWAKDRNIGEAALYSKAAQVLGDLQEARAEQALILRLSFRAEDPRHELFVRMKAADALGRLRSRAAVKPLAAMVATEEPVVRQEYARALARIGGRDALPALVKSTSSRAWELRELSVSAISLLGDEREQAALEKLVKEEPARAQADCKQYGYSGCDAPDKLAAANIAVLGTHLKRLAAAQECKKDAGCWVKKLSDAEPAVRERAALELGRSGTPEGAGALLEHLADPDLDARLAAIQAVSWLMDDSPDAQRQALATLPAIEKQLDSERGKTEFVKVNEDLKRLAAKLKRD